MIFVKDSNQCYFYSLGGVPGAKILKYWPWAPDPWPFEAKLNRLRGLLLCQVSTHCDRGFSFYRANIHLTCRYTHTVTNWSQYRHHCTSSPVLIIIWDLLFSIWSKGLLHLCGRGFLQYPWNGDAHHYEFFISTWCKHGSWTVAQTRACRSLVVFHAWRPFSHEEPSSSSTA